MKKLAIDFKGPIGGSYFVLVIEEFPRFPEVEIIESNSAEEEVISKLDRILGTFGVPDTIKSNNYHLFNSHEIKTYAKKIPSTITKLPLKHTCCNGLTKNFIRMLSNVSNTTIIEGVDPRAEVRQILLSHFPQQYR